jgi:hypothetical protein
MIFCVSEVDLLFNLKVEAIFLSIILGMINHAVEKEGRNGS